MKTVHNERLKITATFLNGLAIATFVVGVLAPAVQTARTTLSPGLVAVGVVCIAASGALHYAARAVLGGLLE